MNGETCDGTITKAGGGSCSYTKCNTVSGAESASNIVTGIVLDTDGNSAFNIKTACGTNVNADSETGGCENSKVSTQIAIEESAHTAA